MNGPSREHVRLIYDCQLWGLQLNLETHKNRSHRPGKDKSHCNVGDQKESLDCKNPFVHQEYTYLDSAQGEISCYGHEILMLLPGKPREERARGFLEKYLEACGELAECHLREVFTNPSSKSTM